MLAGEVVLRELSIARALMAEFSVKSAYLGATMKGDAALDGL